jgi:hypothetical protein
MEKKPLTKGQKIFGVILGMLIVFWVIGSLSGNKSENKNQPITQNNKETQVTETVKEEAIKVSAESLYQSYKENTVNADNIYKGKLVTISGTIGTIGKDIMDDPYVTLKADQYFSNVQCFVDKNDTEISSLKPDQSITMEGRVDGYLMNVIVKKCKIVK